MSIEDLKKARFRKFAKEFADIYIDKGADEAGFFTLDRLPVEEDRIAAREYVTREFEERGYVFPLGEGA